MKKHQKHTKLTRPNIGEFGRNELALVGAPCGEIQRIAYETIQNFSKKHKIAYIDADHAAGDQAETTQPMTAGANKTYLDKINFHRFDTSEKLERFQFTQEFAQQDLILINGNHYKGQEQIVIIHPKKAESLLRKKKRLTDVQLVLLAEGVTEIPTWLNEHLQEKKSIPIFKIQDKKRIKAFFQDKLKTSIPAINGLVLAGGKSVRMGKDKGELNYHGKSQRIYMYEMLEKHCTETYLSGRSEQILEWQKRHSVIADTFTDLGPYGAILSAFRKNPNRAWLSVACDLPLLTESVIKTLIAERDPSKIATAFHNSDTNFPEPLITIWEPKSYPVLLHFLSLGYSCPRKILINSDIKTVRLSNEEVLKNVNSPEELEEVKLTLNPLSKIKVVNKDIPTIFEKTEAELLSQGFRIERKDFNRPWGGFFVIEEAQAADFVAQYFPNLETADLIGGRKVSPKILLVAPEKRLSWQYHHRRSEVWRAVENEVGVVRSETDEQTELQTIKVGDFITLKKGERHRLVGLKEWGKVAEIWQHTEPENPSDEDDIVRLQDDFGRG